MIDKICIVGGGTAGWIAAASLIRFFPDKEITLIESEEIPTIGVGESTTQFFRDWTREMCISDVWMDECEATYKYSVKFKNFSEYGDFHYPFFPGKEPPNAKVGLLDWFLHYRATNGNPDKSFCEWMVPYWKIIEDNKVVPRDVDYFSYLDNAGYHMDAQKFAEYLRREFCVPRGVKHVQGTVTEIDHDETGIKRVYVGDTFYSADLFIDCTGFKSLLLGETLGTEWDEFPFLINDRAWAVRLKYKDKKTEMLNHTLCTALGNGWVWHVPLSTRYGTGYNFSSKFISDEDALEEFKAHLGEGFEDRQISDFRLIEWKNGVSKKIWNKNVVGIGLSAGFIEPLESNGLMSAHNFAMYLCDTLSAHNGKVNTIIKDQFNRRCRQNFQNFAYFVGNHFMLSTREDTPYWKYITQDIDYLSAHVQDEYRVYPQNQIFLDMHDMNIWNMSNLEGNAYLAAGFNQHPVTSWHADYMERRHSLDLSQWRTLESGYELHPDTVREIDDFPTPEEFYYERVSGVDVPHYIHA